MTREHPKFYVFHDSLPVLVVEWSKFGVRAPAVVSSDDKICAQRWMTIYKIAFIPLGAIRLYAIRSLHNSLHYEIPYSQISDAVSVLNKLATQGHEIKIVILDGMSTYQDDDLMCRYDLNLDQIDNICWDHLNRELLKIPSRDNRRNYGFCGWKNAAHEKDLSGLAHPRTHSGTGHPEVKKNFQGSLTDYRCAPAQIWQRSVQLQGAKPPLCWNYYGWKYCGDDKAYSRHCFHRWPTHHF